MEDPVKKIVSLPRALVIGLALSLLVSLAINLMAAGWFVGQRAASPQHMERGMLRHMARTLPEELRAPLRAEIKARRRPLFEAFRDVRQARQAVRTALAQQPFDRAALEAALSEQRQGTARLQQLMHEAMVETAVTISPEQRQRWSQTPLWTPGRPPAALLEGGLRPPRPPAEP